MGGLSLENTHPFCLGSHSLGHNGTIVRFPRLLDDPHVERPKGDTDSEAFFNFLMACYDGSDPVGSLRRAVATTVERSSMSGLNFLFSDGDRLYAYRLGLFDLHWLHRPGQLLVASERVTGERWHTVQQDVLLVLDPDDLEEPHAERLIGDELLAAAHIHKVDKSAPPARRRARSGRRRAGARSSDGRVSRRFALLVNPASAGGRALEALPAVHAELDRLEAQHRTVITRSIEHAARGSPQRRRGARDRGGHGRRRPAAPAGGRAQGS